MSYKVKAVIEDAAEIDAIIDALDHELDRLSELLEQAKLYGNKGLVKEVRARHRLTSKARWHLEDSTCITAHENDI